jgi:hypothetical protein
MNNIMKKAILLISVLMLFFTIYSIKNTFSLYESEKNILSETDIAKWEIKINENSLNDNNEFVIDQIAYDTSSSVKENRIAPGTCGYYDIKIDTSLTDVSVRYDVIFDFSTLKSENLEVKSIVELSNEPLIQTAENAYTGLIKYTSNLKQNIIRVNICWINNEENNQADTEMGMSLNTTIKIPVNIKATQYLGEIIETYEG